MNGLNENNLQELSSRFEQYEAPYSADELQADWQQVASKITSLPQAPSGAAGGSTSTSLFGSLGFRALVGLVAIAAISGLMLVNSPSEQILVENATPNENIATYDDLTNENHIVEVSEELTDLENLEEKSNLSLKPSSKKAQNEHTIDGNQLPKGLNEKTEDGPNANKHLDSNTEVEMAVKASAQISKNEICQNERIKISIANPKEAVLYIFKLEDTKTGKTFNQGSIAKSRSIKLDIAGNFNLLVTEIAENKSRELLNEPIYVREKPKAKMVFEKNNCNQYRFESRSLNALEYTWLMPNKVLTGNIVSYNFANVGFEKITLIAQNEYCADSISKEVFASLANEGAVEIEVPNIFTPNGDGDNDFFEIITKNPHLANKTGSIEVYNQLNDLVFKSTNGLSDAWNGKLLNTGRDCESGNYRYIVSCENSCDPTNMDYTTGVIFINR